MRFLIICTNAIAATAILASCAAQQDYKRLYGDPAPPAAANRTILIHPDTRYVNVEGGQIVRFVADGREFAWQFNVARTVNSFDLNDVAPQGFLRQTVRAYVSPDPKYINAP